MRPCANKSKCRSCAHRTERHDRQTIQHVCAVTGQLHPYDVRYCRNYKNKEEQ